MSDKSKLSTENYKGVRDFYPEEMFVQNYIFSTWKKVVEKFGYVEYGASILEPAELYKAKTGEEIVNEQTYTFTDRGEREVTLRPEMTPTVARMIAAREKELAFPLRWYSMPNLLRYEKPQRGRLREHWQLNVDLFGAKGVEADTEIITIASDLMKSFGAKNSDFVIRLNNRKLINDLYEHFKLSEDQKQKISKIIDKKNKISQETFSQSIGQIIPDKAGEFIRVLSSNERVLDTLSKDNENAKELIGLIEKLGSLGITNVSFDPTLVRGFDYYTSAVFEIFDTNRENQRSIFGGGRYDELTLTFGQRKIPAVGFGIGDVTLRDFLEVHNLLPKYAPTAKLYIATLDETFLDGARKLAELLREKGLNVIIDLSQKKVGEQLKTANRQQIPYAVVIGQDEIKSGTYSIKNMESGEEKKVKAEEIANALK